MKCEGRAEFLNTWEKIYTVGGFAVAGLTLVGGFYISAAKLLTKLAEGSAKNYLKSLIIKAILETNISNFQKNTLKVLEPQEIFSGVEYKALGNTMAENGVIFLGGQKEGKFAESYVAMYKGEVIEEFTKADLSKFNKKWGKVSKEKLEETLEEIADTIKYENGRMGYVEGLFDSIDVNYKPKGFESLKDIENFDPKYGRGIVTKFEGYEGYFYRNFDAKKKIFTFNHGFANDLPGWIEDVKIPLVQGRGIPTHAYFTPRQMKLLNIAEGEIQMVKMSQIQNLDTAAFIHQVIGGKIIRNFDSVDILAAPSNEYMKTVMTQAGYETTSGRIIGQGQYFSVKQLKNRDYPLNPKFEGSYDAFMKEHGLSLSDMLYMNYNIEVKVRYIK